MIRSCRPIPRLSSVLLCAVILSGCSADGGPDAEQLAEGLDPADEPSGAEDPDRDAAAAPGSDESGDEPPACRHDALPDEAVVVLTGDDDADLAERIATTSHACAPTIVVAPPDDPWTAAIAAPVADAADAPLLLASEADAPSLTSAAASLDAEELLTVGLPPVDAAIDVTALTASTDEASEDHLSDGLRRVELAVRVAEHLDTRTFLAVDTDDVEARGGALARLDAESALLALPLAELTATAERLPAGSRVEVLSSADGEADRIADDLVGLGIDAQTSDTEGGLWPAGAATTWLVDPDDGASTAVAAVAVAGRDEALLPVDADDPRTGRERTQRIRDTGAERHVLIGAADEDAGWQLTTVLEGDGLPWGGFRLFEDERMVALYGSVETEVLGALGEQQLDETVERLRGVAEPYGADGTRVLPAFELITTIASASPEPSGDYSRRTPIEQLRPWVDRAAEEGLYVLLDLQPGRTDFLTQAREYEELLREPHVGLALDPEWRLEADEVHLQQIGSVDATEVQEVADWLAELTREHQLPEKLLVLHQFRFSMLPDRDTIVAPPELAVVVHMDGQGPIGTKYETYDAITAGAEDRWLWGWKNFYDEDTPTPTPEQVLELDPLPVLITYQ